MKDFKNVNVPPYMNWPIFCWISVRMVFWGLMVFQVFLKMRTALSNYKFTMLVITTRYFKNIAEILIEMA